jgi:prepilin-type processing-associated H-X9-DG protein
MKTRDEDDGRAFTMVEMLVVIGLITVLMAMILPAIGQARAASRRVECASRLQQIGLAVADYEVHTRMLPVGNRNLVRQLGPALGGFGRDGSTTEIWRCPGDSFIQRTRAKFALSFAPTENDADPDALLYSPWSIEHAGRIMPRTMDTVGPNTVMLVEYWHPGNEVNVFSEQPGWARRTLRWNGGPCPREVPPVTPVNVGGYLFLRAFAEQTAASNRPRSLTTMYHSGLINLAFPDGHVEAKHLVEITAAAPDQTPIWTRQQD